MSRLIMCQTARRLVKEAEAAGFAIIRTGASGHLKMRHLDGRLLMIPMHPGAYKGSREAGLLRSIRGTISGAPSRGLAAVARKIAAIIILIAVSMLTAGTRVGSASVDIQFPTINPAVFLLVTMDEKSGRYLSYGTAWFFDDHGDAFTATHVVGTFFISPTLTRLVGIFPNGTTRYANLICANPTILQGESGLIGKDVAIIHVEDASPPGRSIMAKLVIAEHTDEPLGTTPFIPLLETTPFVPSQVVIVGYGWRGDVPHQRKEFGRLLTINRVGDGTRIQTIDFINRPTHGDSGSPIIDSSGRAVGIFDWVDWDEKKSTLGYGVSTPDVSCPNVT